MPSENNQSDSSQTRARASTAGESQAPTRRNSVRDFWKTNVSSLQRRVTRRGKRRATIDKNPSRRASRTLGVPSSNDKEPLDGKDDASESSNEVTRSPTMTHQDLRPLTANPPGTPGRLTKMTTLSEEPQPQQLSETELGSLFRGAPEFRAMNRAGNQAPVAIYHELDMSNLDDTRDWTEFSHPTFSASTNRMRSDELPGADATSSQLSRGPPEMPSMLTLHGLEPGTYGFDHFLQLPLSDTRMIDEDFDNYENRRLLLQAPNRLGLRHVDVERLIDRLSEIEDFEAQRKESDDVVDHMNEQKAAEMYADLFAKFLEPPKFTAAAEDDPTGLQVQIEALVKVLETKNLWYDFSYVEQRIRLGQLLWSEQDESDGSVMATEQTLVLLQITLASELLIRMEAMDNLSKEEPPNRDSSATQIANLLTKKTSWDLILARRFIDNVRIASGRYANTKDGKKENRGSIFSILSFVTANESFDDDEADVSGAVQPIMYPRHERKQLDGLAHFAKAIHWPHADEVTAKLGSRIAKPPALTFGAYATPIATPVTIKANRNSYFGEMPRMTRTKSAQSVQLVAPASYDADNFDAGGWLSRSWLTGLVMPGETASHFLITTLLEKSPSALERLGDEANLHGGFVYGGDSWWSKSCVVGRVMAAAEGASDCMGWVYVPESTREVEDGWMSIQSLDPVMPATPRILDTGALSQDSTAFPKAEVGQLLDEDFSWPADSMPPPSDEASFEGLSFEASNTHFELHKPVSPATIHEDDTPATEVGATSTRTALLTFRPSSTSSSPFSSTTDSDIQNKATIPLRYEVNFVSSYPCFPTQKSILSAPTPIDSTAPSPVLDKSSPKSQINVRMKEKDLPARPCHALHASYSYGIVPADSLLAAEDDDFESYGIGIVQGARDGGEEEGVQRRKRNRVTQIDGKANTSPERYHGGHMVETSGNGTKQETHAEKILVLDCRGSWELQLLARAWCAKIGEHALVGREGRTCLACCVREAKGLGMKVVIRI